MSAINYHERLKMLLLIALRVIEGQLCLYSLYTVQ